MKHIGIETEYCVVPGGALHSTHEVGRQLLVEFGAAEEVGFVGYGNRFYANGMRGYVDVGDHFETATGLADSVLESVMCDWASRRMTGTAADRIANKYAATGPYYGLPPAPQTFLRVSDGEVTWGRHINVAAGRALGVNQSALAPVLVHWLGALPTSGSGMLDPANYLQTLWSQKAITVVDYVSPTDTKNKPIINSRDQPHADRRKYRRLHIVGNDALHSPYATWLQIGSLSLLTRFCEAVPQRAETFERYLPVNASHAAHAYNHDYRRTKTLEGQDGRKRTMAELAQLSYDVVQAAVEEEVLEVDTEDEYLLDAWGDGLELQNRQDKSAEQELTTLFDSYKRRSIHASAMARGYSAKKLRALDYACDRVGDDKQSSIMQKSLETAGFQRLAEIYGTSVGEFEQKIEERKHTPPAGRDAIRGRIIDYFGPMIRSCDYEMVKIGNTYFKFDDLDNPTIEQYSQD